MTDKQPTTKPAVARKRPKITAPRLYNAIEEIVKEEGLDPMSASIGELYDALEAAIVKDARGL